MHVILSVPIPSLEAKFIGQILSNIVSIILHKPSPVTYPPPDPFTPGELLPLLFNPFLEGDATLFLLDVFVDMEEVLDGDGSFIDPLLIYLFFYSYTKLTAS